MSYTARLVEPVFYAVEVTSEDQSPFCRIFYSCTDLQEEFISYLPRTFSFGDSSVTAEPSNTSDESCGAPAASPESIVLERVRIFFQTKC